MPHNDSTPLTVITGASSSIGLELARVFGENGHDLLVCSETEGEHSPQADGARVGREVTDRAGGRALSPSSRAPSRRS
jgi:NAD(P)-dependent dehydrogenase (short-subunit alcohol dehydrogenase family)